MRIVGIVLISIGIALIAFIGYTYFRDRNKMISPLPEDTGIKVIFVTPSQ